MTEPNVPALPQPDVATDLTPHLGDALRLGEGERVHTFVNRQGIEVTEVDSGRADAGTGKVRKPRGKNLGTVVGPGVRVTQRDLFWLELVARYKYLSYEELAVWSSTSPSALRNRIPRLVRAGFLDAWRVHAAETVVTPTRRAASRHDLDYLVPPTGIEPADLTLLHTSAVARVGMMVWWTDPDCADLYTLTEREVRAALRNGGVGLLTRDTGDWDTPAGTDPEQWVIPSPGGFTYTARADGSQVLSGGYRLPDLVLLRRGLQPVAIEVELSAKSQDAYQDLFECYLSAEGRARFAGVQYYCGSRHVAAEVSRAVRKVPGAEAFIHVSEFPDDMPLPISRIQRVTGRKLGAGA